jgi:DNA-binding transcriptional LysR family regulator
MVDFEWYRSFVAVYQLGTVSAAAEQRTMTQPAISQHLAALEHSLNERLFQRTPRQMIPTDAGKALYAQVAGAVEQLERLSSPAVLRLSQSPLEVKVGVPREYFYIEGLVRLPKPASTAYRLNVTLGQTTELINQVESRQLHAALATHRIAQRIFHLQPLQTERFVLVGPSEISVPSTLDKHEMAVWLEQQHWIAYAPDVPIIRRYWQEVFGCRPNIMPYLVLPDLLMIQKAIAHGLGISVLPEYLCQEALAAQTMKILWHPEVAPGNQLYLACLRERLHESAIQWFMEIMQEGVDRH